jgi:hypothetical protein
MGLSAASRISKSAHAATFSAALEGVGPVPFSFFLSLELPLPFMITLPPAPMAAFAAAGVSSAADSDSATATVLLQSARMKMQCVPCRGLPGCSATLHSKAGS